MRYFVSPVRPPAFECKFIVAQLVEQYMRILLFALKK